MADDTIPSNWRGFLSQSGAVFENGSVLHFGNPEVERSVAATSDILVDLCQFSLWQVCGDDAGNFLQGQLSNDIREVSEQRGQLSAYCNPKGRMYAIFLVMRRDDSYYLQLPATLAEATFKRLRMYILRAKVAIAPVGTELARIGVAGPNAESLVSQAAGSVPAEPYDCATNGELLTIRLPGSKPRFELVASPAYMEGIWNKLAQHARPAGTAIWSWLDIVAGIPSVHAETTEEFVPQMANLDLAGGVSFKKGCYPGQEIVARMHYLGHLKQRMVRASVMSDFLPAPGTAVYSPDFSGQTAGRVVDAQFSPIQGIDMLVVAQVSSIKADSLHLSDEKGPRLQIHSLPYVVPLE